MLDNMEPDLLRENAATLKTEFPHVLIEASGVGELYKPLTLNLTRRAYRELLQKPCTSIWVLTWTSLVGEI